MIGGYRDTSNVNRNHSVAHEGLYGAWINVLVYVCAFLSVFGAQPWAGIGKYAPTGVPAPSASRSSRTRVWAPEYEIG